MVSTYSRPTSPVPTASASGRLRLGFCTSAAAKVTLFQASLEKSDPTIAAPTTGTIARLQSPVPQKAAKLAAATSGCRNSVSPQMTSTASAPTLATVNMVWIAAPSLTPRMFTAGEQDDQEDRDDALGREAELDRFGAPGMSDRPRTRKTSGLTEGTSTPRKRAKATATAAMVPLWMTANRVQP